MPRYSCHCECWGEIEADSGFEAEMDMEMEQLFEECVCGCEEVVEDGEEKEE